jgi:hypothetical protein
VARDVADGVVSAESARDFFGVEDPERSASSAAGRALTVSESEIDAYTPSGPSKKRVIALNPTDVDALAIAEGEKVELLGKDGAPLRGWVIFDEAIAPGTVLLDAIGSRTLGTSQGEQVRLRRLNTPFIEHQTVEI